MTNIREENSYDVIIIGAGGAGHDVRRTGWSSRAQRGVNRPFEHDRQKNPDFRRRPLQLHKYQCHTGKLCFPRIRISPSQHWRDLRPTIFLTMVRDHPHSLPRKKIRSTVFCDDSAEQIVDMLVSECESAYAEIHSRLSSLLDRKNPTSRSQ